MELPLEKLASMSPKGTQLFREVKGSQAALNPWVARLLSMDSASATQLPAPPTISACAIAGFRPPGRKKFIRAEFTQGPRAPNPQGAVPVPTVNGLPTGSPAAIEAFRLPTIRSPRMVFALIGRLRCRPPLKLYARFKAKPRP